MKPQDIKAPYLLYEDIRKFAEDFLGSYNQEDKLPVPIEEIVEIQLKIVIIPAQNIRLILGVDGWLSNDFKNIYVDLDVFDKDKNESRYFFTLAHEIGHYFLHREIFESLTFSDILEWKKIMYEVPPNEYGWLETHAYNFAGLILVPEHHLRNEYNEAVSMVSKEGFDRNKHKEIFNDYVSSWLQNKFKVSARTIEKRIQFDNLS